MLNTVDPDGLDALRTELSSVFSEIERAIANANTAVAKVESTFKGAGAEQMRTTFAAEYHAPANRLNSFLEDFARAVGQTAEGAREFDSNTKALFGRQP